MQRTSLLLFFHIVVFDHHLFHLLAATHNYLIVWDELLYISF